MLVAFAGLPCSGKSTLAMSLGQQLGASFYLEPEEEEWPKWITAKNTDQFSALNWFRSARVPVYREAVESAKIGLTFIDSFYDVLIHYYLGKPEFSWLISSDNPYFSIIRETARLDAQLLPKPDCLVFLKLDEACWRHLLLSRGRQYDESVNIERYFYMQEAILRAVELYCTEKKVRYFIVDQTINGLDQVKTQILKKLKID